MNRFPKETSLKIELMKAMERLGLLGISYPSGYIKKLLDKYSSGVTYPRILMRIGEPNIRKHPLYKEILEKRGELLDYGCGTGDDIRALLTDGYLKNKVKGFDIDWNSIDIGLDLYRDKEDIQDVFVVTTAFPFNRESFDIVYSGSVLHTLKQKDRISNYLNNAYNVLKHDGILFGSALGADNHYSVLDEDARLILLTEKELQILLKGAGFTDIKVTKTNVDTTKNPKYRLWFSGTKNSN
jgi:SAM-dependent methyltransferase